jgi:hypothetical protein
MSTLSLVAVSLYLYAVSSYVILCNIGKLYDEITPVLVTLYL